MTTTDQGYVSIFWGCVLASYPDYMAWVWGYYSVQSGTITTCKPDTNSAYLGKSTEKMAWPNLKQLQQPLALLHCFISCECHANLVSKYRSCRDKMATCRIRLRTTSTQLLGGHCGSLCNATKPNHQNTFFFCYKCFTQCRLFCHLYQNYTPTL